jgi:hypothetical protein
MNHLHNLFATPSFPEQEDCIDALSFKDVASFLGIGEMTAYQDEQKALALLRKTFPTPDTLFSITISAHRDATGGYAPVCLHPRRKNWFPVRRVVCNDVAAPCLTTTAIVFQLLYRRNAKYRPAVFRKQHGCWREVALVRRLIFFEERLLAQLNRPLPGSWSRLEGLSLGLQIELEEGIDASGPFRLPVPTAFLLMAQSEKGRADV